MSSTPTVRSIRFLPKAISELNRTTGSPGEVFYDREKKALRVFDGSTTGGNMLLRADLSNISGGGSTETNVNFGTRTVQSAGFIGTISSISNHNLDDLGNVDVAGATDGQLLYYNATELKWKPFSLSGNFNGGSISLPLNIVNSTASTGTASGALTVSGGVGIAKKLYVGETITGNDLSITTGGASITGNSTITGILTATAGLTVNTGPVAIRGNNRLRLYDTDNSNFIGLRSPANLTADVTYQLPGQDGTAGQVLTTNGLGILSWATVSGGGGGSGGGVTNPAGSNTQIQFNDNGLFGADAGLTFDSGTGTLSTGFISLLNNLDGQDAATLTGFASISLIDGVTVTAFVNDNTLSSINSTEVIPTVYAVKNYVDDGLSLKANADNPTFTGTVTGVTSEHVGLGNVENVALSTWAGSTNITTIGTLPSLNVSGTAVIDGNVTTNSNFVVSNAPTTNNHATNKRYVDTRAIAMSIALS